MSANADPINRLRKSTPTSSVHPANDPAFRKLADLAKLGSDPIRMHVILLLADAPMDLGDLVEATGTATPTLAPHLAVLRAASLVENSRRDGRASYELTARGRLLAGAVDALGGVRTRRLAPARN
jgi:DNA-binding transcriptional ArsR family regulator